MLSDSELDDLEGEFSPANGWTDDEESYLRRLIAQAREANALRKENDELREANLRNQHWADLAIADMHDRINRGELFDPEHVKQAEADIAAGRVVDWEDLKKELRDEGVERLKAAHAALAARCAEMEEALRETEAAHGKALNGILELAAWSEQYHNGAPDCDCGHCRAKAILSMNSARAALDPTTTESEERNG